ncbi:uncharacterized protein Z519_10470 [Cladophialophora bantiana CBS 173.52]|uniref:Uncharacterized protein n=1 Tax=Cladophialophora bantiana (strain ATCC 10958 / CBS 173.52 / CDC B-1940 / NIH 8579) TaxID=1442370 RepID=A0A0D2EG30_CLAB1|nr:uncharacterized protein Z519_10470 [Cladophialophora bantiana CBS 173.52]KIW88986.1 hypothetical protein Z519_10470 [Cladophialophora bantiana CBS 173.52]
MPLVSLQHSTTFRQTQSSSSLLSFLWSVTPGTILSASLLFPQVKADEESWDPDGSEYCLEDQEVPDTSEEEPTEDGDGDGPEATVQGQKAEINPYHTDARQGSYFLRRALFAAGACLGLMHAWNWFMNSSKPVGLWVR